MGRNITFLQDIQDAYALLADLGVVIIDEDGNELTHVSNHNSISRITHDHWGENKYYQEFINPLKVIRQPTVIDNRMGLKIIVSPIRTSPQHVGFILAGYFMEMSARPFVCEYAKRNFPEIKGLEQAIKEVPELSDDEINERCQTIGKLVDIAETYFKFGIVTKHEDESTAFLYRNLESMRLDQANPSSFIEEMYHLHHQIEFIGLAVEKENEEYHIETLHGSNTDQLKGLTFLMGEGFLGHTLATEQLQFWQNVSNDPRVNFFRRHRIEPKSLFCVPIYKDKTVIGILFGGSLNKEITDTRFLDQLKIHSSLLSVLVTSQHLKENLHNHLMELSTFNEVFRVMTTVKEIKRVLYILVDISINIIRGPFACIVFKPEVNQSKVDIVSRGLKSTEINGYGYEVAVRAFSKSKIVNWEEPIQQETSWGTKVLEFPLRYNDQLYGVLCVGLSPGNSPEKFKPFLSSLAIAGSISIHLCQNGDAAGTDDYIINLLYELLRQQNEVKYQLAEKIKMHVKDFISYLNERNRTLVKISGLVCYEFEFLKGYLSDNKSLSILEGCFRVLEQKESSSRESEILALVYKFSSDDEKLESIHELESIDYDLREQFTSYIQKQLVVETVISFEEERPVASKNNPISESTNVTDTLKKKLGLSSREIEVLNQVLKGFNNREIATNLFISEHTVKNHITRILQKLGVSDRSQAIAMIYQLGYSPI
ncbi:LuxR C-terminal-related transcriptional regulator [Halalkalibacter alkaliphilus]|uniref:LuxR C-terminal-related transcriptional regulator n=1 Tax=Halalkalibacter alkaliphilus TaxID=2917993 RepID=A0A9X2CV81_9BACI|nr:LuxR C-terminal-related transcriptional regulator [Halalkalibacter alkaliphilus]MCL7748946.1 LuxR C-terminal-related transcriptional regulator [Halalkalibacter alkaliphilus]